MSTMNMVSSYRESEHLFHPDFVAWNKNDTTVQIYCRIKPSEFLFERHSDDSFKARVNIRVELIESYEVTKLTDSVTGSFVFNIADKPDYLILPLTLHTHNHGKSLLHFFVMDNNKGVQEDFFLSLDRLSNPSRQDFLVTNSKNEPIFRNYLFSSDSINITYKDKSFKNFICYFYHRDFDLAAPPYSFDVRSEFNYRPDSIFSISIDKKNMVFEKEGFYHIKSDTARNDGLTLFRFSGNYPEITNPKQMIEAARYLISKKEYDEMKSAPSPKAMIENFWLTHGGNEERSRLLIKKYYGRVRDANKYFASYTEGWRTDRGMIYTIFGMPNSIYKSPESESWTYGTVNSSLALNFFFIKVNNPFTENDYSLSRSPSYESNWFRAVEIWRQGRAYNSFY